MARMRKNSHGTGYIRCKCGTRVRIRDGVGVCCHCGAEAQEIIHARRRVCALETCGCQYIPTHPAQRTCCPEHGRLYQNQEQRRRRAMTKTKRRAAQTAAEYGRGGWGWLRTAPDMSGHRRRILHTLERQSEDGSWPYHDVLAGVGHSPMDDCPF